MLIALMLAIFPACPSDGLTANDPSICVYDARGDNMSGKSFIATPDLTILIPGA